MSIEDLTRAISASPATIRRDLLKLEEAGLLKRVRGGAASVSGSVGEPPSLIRKQTNVAEKKSIAKYGARFFENGASYFVDSSSTASHLAPYLANLQNVTVITDSLENAIAFSSVSHCNVYIAGGNVQPRSFSSVGPDTIDFISSFNCDALFFSCHGFTVEGGPMEGTIDQQRCKGAMLKHSKTHILLADHSKFGSTFVASVCPLTDLDIVITDKEPSQEYLEAFDKAGIRLIVAE